MFSNDKNIEHLAMLVEKLKEYIGLEKRFFQLNAMEKIVRILSVLVLTIILAFFALLVVIFISFSAAYALTEVMHPALAFLSLAVFYIILFVTVYNKRSTWIQRPLIQLFANILSN